MNFTPKEKKEPKKKLTDAELLAIRKAKQEEREKDLAVADALGKRLPKMTDKQLRGELKRVVRGERAGKEWKPGLRISFATILTVVFENTKTPTNPKGKLHAYPI